MWIIDILKQEWQLIRRKPVSFLTFLAVGAVSGYEVAAWHDSGHVEVLNAQMGLKDSQISRYRVALGIDPASKGALVELNNQELSLRADSIVAKMRKLRSDYDLKIKQIKAQAKANKPSQTDLENQNMDALAELSKEFDQSFSSDADNMEHELRRRLDSAAVAHIVGVPAFVAADGTRLLAPQAIRNSGLSEVYISTLADEIEQMARLLPPDHEKQ